MKLLRRSHDPEVDAVPEELEVAGPGVDSAADDEDEVDADVGTGPGFEPGRCGGPLGRRGAGGTGAVVTPV